MAVKEEINDETLLILIPEYPPKGVKSRVFSVKELREETKKEKFLNCLRHGDAFSYKGNVYYVDLFIGEKGAKK